MMSLLWLIMLFSCRNDMGQINALDNPLESLPEMSGENLIMIYSDSAVIQYKIITPKYTKKLKDQVKYDEFPEGIHVISYDQNGIPKGEITALYACRKEDENIWETRNNVVVTNADGTKLETELLYWNMEKERIYSPRYSRLTFRDNINIIEGNNGFESDQELKNPVFNNITGAITVSIPN